MLLEPRSTYIVDYPQAVDLTNEQIRIMWFPEEIKVEKDVQDIRVNLTPAERHGVITTLKLFTQYELLIGNDYWDTFGGLVARKPACFSRMANCNSFVENNVHGPFYSKINEALGLATEEFYESYTKDPVLQERMQSLSYGSHVNPEDPHSVANFLIMLSMAEGAILYSNFAFLKHFQSNGKNKISNIVRGINFSVRDESLHCKGSALAFRILCSEYGLAQEVMQNRAADIAAIVREHEHRIVDMIFEEGEIEGITATQMKNFVDSRIDLVMRDLGLNAIHKPSHNPIAEWFYKGINDYQANDFFQGIGREYTRGHDENDFMD